MFWPILVLIFEVTFSGMGRSENFMFVIDILGEPTETVSSVRSWLPGGRGTKLNYFLSIFLLDWSFLNIGF